MTEISEEENFVLVLDQFTRLLAAIGGELVEPKLAGIDLPGEYRWEIEPLPDYLLAASASPFTDDERTEVAAFVEAMRHVPRDAGPLTAPHWQDARRLALPLLRRMEAARGRMGALPTPGR